MAPAYESAFTRLRSTTGEWMVHPELRPMLVRDAKEHGTSLIEMAVKIVADTYGVPYEVTPRTTEPTEAGDVLNLRLPVVVARAVTRQAGRRGESVSLPNEVRKALSRYYGLAMPPKIRHTRNRTRAA